MAKVKSGLQQLDCNMGTGFGIGQGMMVIGKVITAGCGNRLQLMVRQTAAEMLTGCRKGNIELILRIIHPVHFENLIDAAYRKTGQKVVIIIDEYEKPIINNFDNHEVMEQFMRELQGFYSVIKAKDNAIRFAFLTGVTKLGKMSIFSGLNNLNDISMDARYADICGISEQELKSYFGESMKTLAEMNGLSEEECYEKLASMYDGYHFCEDSIGVYNPFSLLNTFNSGKFRMSWFEIPFSHDNRAGGERSSFLPTFVF